MFINLYLYIQIIVIKIHEDISLESEMGITANICFKLLSMFFLVTLTCSRGAGQY